MLHLVMDNKVNEVLDQKSAQRFKEFQRLLGLTPIGMAAFLKISTDHIYSLRRGRRSISDPIAESLAVKLGLNTADVYNSNFKLRQTKIDFESMNDFIIANKINPNYFMDKKKENSLTFTIKAKLLENAFFDVEKRVNQVVEELTGLQIKVNSEKATKSLIYLVDTGYLTFQKRPIIKKDGSEGKLLVNYYIEP